MSSCVVGLVTAFGERECDRDREGRLTADSVEDLVHVYGSQVRKLLKPLEDTYTHNTSYRCGPVSHLS